ncbi:hypothetical protein K6119_18285 [Paracrocinitomix mangrovi]|uniref:hypothetical protein n=1 Tax=Paracrocinitomix mangrovi TaxID=2862509 RepID=UPI001C8EEC6E|nr:hypothetical protein [Paracrocinitomix mangrovi]UKN01675.1 hypothetical protein K6119_18285 [Paracrocinitomix mangrovi]
MSEEIIDQNESGGATTVPDAVKTLSILSIVGNSLWGLLILIALFYILGATGSMGRFMPAGAGGMVAMVVVIIILMLLLNVLGLVAAIKMMQGNKKAFILYAIVTGIWALLMLVAGANGGQILNIVSGLASAGFIVALGMQMKNMPD